MAKTTRAAKKAAPAPVVEVVSQDTISALYAKRAEAAELTTKLNALKKQLEAEEAILLAKLKGGTPVQPGVFVAAVDSHPGRCTPKWKDEAVLLAAAQGISPTAYEESVKAKYPAKMVEDLMITKLG